MRAVPITLAILLAGCATAPQPPATPPKPLSEVLAASPASDWRKPDPAERVELEMLRTDSATFQQVIDRRRYRKDDWYKEPAGAVDVCNVPLPVRPPKK